MSTWLKVNTDAEVQFSPHLHCTIEPSHTSQKINELQYMFIFKLGRHTGVWLTVLWQIFINEWMAKKTHMGEYRRIITDWNYDGSCKNTSLLENFQHFIPVAQSIPTYQTPRHWTSKTITLCYRYFDVFAQAKEV